MAVTKKSKITGKSRKKRIPPVVVVTNTIVPAEETLFPEKLKRAQDILSKTKFMDGR